VQNGGLAQNPESAFGKAGLSVALSRSASRSDVEHALARGGADEKGADVAILSLPEFSASYDTLRALDPAMFLAVGWSNGKHLVLGDPKPLKLLTKVSRVSLQAEAGSPEAFLGVLALELSGVSADRIDLLAPSPDSTARLIATTSDQLQSQPETLRDMQLLSTAVAVRAVPYVAVAQRSLLEKHEATLLSFARLWLEGLIRVRKDAPGAAREVAKLDEGLEPLALLDQLGKLEPSSLTENAGLLPKTGAGFSLEALFVRDWSMRQKMKLIASPPPESPPVSTEIATLLGEQAEQPDKGAERALTQPAKALFVYNPGAIEEDAFVSEVAFLAGVFARSKIELAGYSRSMFDEALSVTLADKVVKKFGVTSEQLSPEKLSPHSLSPYRISISEAR
jgi:hypothetical protein